MICNDREVIMKFINNIGSNPYKKIDIEMRLPFFESQRDSFKENRLRKNFLQKSNNTQAIELLDKLEECCTDKHCNSPACAICSRNYRIFIINEVSKNIVEPSNWVVVTLIYYSDVMTTKYFCRFDIKRLKAKLYKELERAGFQNMVIGGFEIDFHTDIKRWMPHFHLLIGNEPNALKRLRNMMLKQIPSDPRYNVITRPMKVSSLTNVYEQISYNFKPYSMEVRAYSNHEEKRRTAKYRLASKRFVLSLIKLDQIGFSNLCFQYKCRIAIQKCQWQHFKYSLN